MKIDSKMAPAILASPEQAGRIARAIHALVDCLPSMHAELKAGDGSNPSVRFARNEDYFTLRIEEDLEEIERPPTMEEKRRPSWAWNNKSNQPGGRLTFRIGSNQRLRGRNYWTESPYNPLEKILAKLTERIAGLFQKFEEERAADVKRKKDWEVAEVRRKEAEVRKAHEDKIDTLAEQRARNLLRAAEWWRLHKDMVAFIEACERKWKEKGNGTLLPEQTAWLNWARSQADRTSPFAIGYPDPVKHGEIDEATIPFGGPYPASVSIPDPPSLVQKQVSSSSSYYNPYHYGSAATDVIRFLA